MFSPTSRVRTLAFRGEQFAQSRASRKGFVSAVVIRFSHAGVMGEVGGRAPPGLDVVSVDGQGPREPCCFPAINPMPQPQEAEDKPHWGEGWLQVPQSSASLEEGAAGERVFIHLYLLATPDNDSQQQQTNKPVPKQQRCSGPPPEPPQSETHHLSND